MVCGHFNIHCLHDCKRSDALLLCLLFNDVHEAKVFTNTLSVIGGSGPLFVSVVSVYKMAAVGDYFNNQPSYTERRAAAAAADKQSTNDRKRVSEYFRFMNIVEKQAKEQGITPLAVVQAMDIEMTADHCQVSKYVKA